MSRAHSELVSVVIPTHDRAETVSRAVESVLEQTYAQSEVIVVDDGSTDDTRAALERFGDRIRSVYQPNRGVSAARNAGVAVSRGEWIAFLDSDDVWLPNKLATQVAFHESHPEIPISQTGEIWIRNGVRVNPCRHHAKPRGDIFCPSLERCLVSPSAVMMRRTLYEELGGFDEEMAVCEDYDLWLRIGRCHSFGLIEEPLMVKYGGHDDQLSRRYWGMDRFRVRSIDNILRQPLAADRREAAVRVLRQKCAVLAKGARRRGKVDEAASYDALAARHAHA